MEKMTKQEIVKSAKAVKRKLKLMRDMTSENQTFLESVLKPITQPLNEIAERSGINEKTKNEYEKSPDYHSTPKKLKLNYSDTKPSSSHDETVFELNRSSTKSKEHRLEGKDVKKNESDFEEESELEEDYSNSDSVATDEETFESVSSLDRNFSSPLSFSAKAFEDVPYGVRLDRGKLMMGLQRVYVADKTITINGHAFQKTQGLVQLLFKKIPNLNLVTEDDKENYKLMLHQTNAHHRDFDSTKPIKSNRGSKYLQVIKPLFKHTRVSNSTDNLAVGDGLNLLKKVQSNTGYVYWDDPNELVDRLKLLIASRDAGNTGLENEIISIVEELREAGIIQ
ncbi:uncharacterized protein LOC134805942 [Cydia splendana]|uniref:uncharacterized protein LOC134805942 n=1 Tax=Cydia splendana TaxID=1100963 RepID=UPI00300CE2C6